MTLEEEFEKWWARSSAESYPDTKEAFLEAYRLGLTRAAEICNEIFNAEKEAGDVDDNFPDNAWTRICSRAILTERDKGN